MGKCKKSHIRTIHLKYQPQHGMKNLNYLMDHILYINIYLENGQKSVNPSIIIYANNIEDRIKFEIKTGYHLELLTPEKLLISTLKVK